MRQAAVFIGLFAAMGGAAGCSEEAEPPAAKPIEKEHGLSPEQAAQPLVKIGDRVITVGDFAERLAEKSPYLRARYSSPQRRHEFLDELVKFELLALEAEREGLFESPSVQRTRRQVMIQQMMKAEFEDKVQLSNITEKEIEAYYKAHPEEFNKPAQVRASQIVLSDPKQADSLYTQLRKDQAPHQLFRQLARQHSEDPETRVRGGDMQFFSRPEQRQSGEPEVPEAVARAAFDLEEIGDLARVTDGDNHYILMLTGRRRAMSRSLDHARRPIQNRLWRQKRDAAIDAFVAQLRSQAEVETHWDRLSQVQLDDQTAGAPPAGTKE